MRRRIKLAVLLVLLEISVFLNVTLLVQNVNATYVEGPITQDTTWTLADSPYIVINDVTVNAGVKLTIEPGVEVRFGGNFSLLVQGNFSAEGTTDKPIVFTSNKITPAPKDWKSITISPGSANASIFMKFCIVKYATKGIIAGGSGKNLTLVIEKNKISNSDLGIATGGGTPDASPITIRENEIESNRRGIEISPGNLLIQGNRVFSNNETGMFLFAVNPSFPNVFYSGYSVKILNNTVHSNKQIGIYILTNMANVSVSGNKISANGGGKLQVSHLFPLGTYFEMLQAQWGLGLGSQIISAGMLIYDPYQGANVTHNSISFNQYGVYYDYWWIKHPVITWYAYPKSNVNYNDIYSNAYGMNVSGSYPHSSVNAEYNYWGDSSGPYHPSLNPLGKGNPVNGDGRNLDFIPFLSAPNDYINQRPTANLQADKTNVVVNQAVTFDASASTDDRRIDKYFFDFGDGKNSSWTTLSVVKYNYTSPGVYDASLIVMDDFGVESTNTATLTITVVQELPQLTVSLTLNPTSITSGGQVSITAHVTSGTNVIASAYVQLVSDKGGTFSPASGYTDSNGDFTTTFTAPIVIEQTNVRITATAFKNGYADGSDYEYASVLPPGALSLSVKVTANPGVVQSGQTSTITVRVTAGTNPIADATVALSSDKGGTLSPMSGYTNSSGYLTSAYAASIVTTQTTITITATATKTGYLNGQGQTQITVQPATLSVTVTANPTTVQSSQTSAITVRVTYGNNPIYNATIALSSDKGGTLSPTSGQTDSNGYFTSTFTAPTVTTQTTITITANATKTGYLSGQGQTQVTVTPSQPQPQPQPQQQPDLTLWIYIAVVIIILIAIGGGVAAARRRGKPKQETTPS